MRAPALDEARLMLLARLGESRVIYLRNFSILTSIGIHDFEKAAPQRLVVNVEIFLRPKELARDEIDEVLDYDQLRRGIGELAASRHWNLQETLVEQIMQYCLGHDMVIGARISTEKPDVYPDCDAVGLEFIRFKALT